MSTISSNTIQFYNLSNHEIIQAQAPIADTDQALSTADLQSPYPLDDVIKNLGLDVMIKIGNYFDRYKDFLTYTKLCKHVYQNLSQFDICQNDDGTTNTLNQQQIQSLSITHYTFLIAKKCYLPIDKNELESMNENKLKPMIISSRFLLHAHKIPHENLFKLLFNPLKFDVNNEALVDQLINHRFFESTLIYTVSFEQFNQIFKRLNNEIIERESSIQFIKSIIEKDHCSTEELSAVLKNYSTTLTTGVIRNHPDFLTMAVTCNRPHFIEVLLADCRFDSFIWDALKKSVSTQNLVCLQALLACSKVDPSVNNNEVYQEALNNQADPICQELLKDPRVSNQVQDF